MNKHVNNAVLVQEGDSNYSSLVQYKRFCDLSRGLIYYNMCSLSGHGIYFDDTQTH